MPHRVTPTAADRPHTGGGVASHATTISPREDSLEAATRDSPTLAAPVVDPATQRRTDDQHRAEPGRTRFHEHRGTPWILFVGDLLTCGVLGGIAVAIRLALAVVWPIQLNAGQIASVVLGLMLLPVGYWLMGLYPGYGVGPVDRLRRSVRLNFVVFCVVMTWMAFYGGWQPSRGAMLIGLILITAAMPLTSAGLRMILRRKGMWGRPVVVVGEPVLAERAIRGLREASDLGLIPVAVLLESHDQERAGSEIAGIPVRGTLSQLKSWTQRTSVAVVAMPAEVSVRAAKLVSRLPFPEVILVPDMPGITSLCVTSRDLGGLLGLQIRKNLILRRNWLIKRVFDLMIASAAALIALPVLLVCMALIRMVNKGPAIFPHDRVGLGGRRIRAYKLRTMYLDAERRLEELLEFDPEAREAWDLRCKLDHDPRVLPLIGKFLRRTSLDELPQLWNVLKGDMSLVGPRPLPEYHLDHLPVKFRSLRRTVRPGMTGLWQVSGRANGCHKRMEELDSYYIRNWSMWLDVYIIGRTISAVLKQDGAR